MNWIERLHGDVSGYPTLAEVERGLIVDVLQKTGANCSRAARILGIDRRTLYRRLAAYGARIETRQETQGFLTVTHRRIVLDDAQGAA